MIKQFTFPIYFWMAFILAGFIVKVLHIMSSAFIVIGFAGLMAFIIHQYVLKKNNSLHSILLITGVLFLIVLFGGAYFNNGYPINYVGVYIYLITLPIIYTGIMIKSLIKKDKE